MSGNERHSGWQVSRGGVKAGPPPRRLRTLRRNSAAIRAMLPAGGGLFTAVVPATASSGSRS
jgi:hypothetical protein